MFAREKIGLDPAWRSRLVNFFQYLTQAVVRVDRAALVASLLATDPRKSDTLGKEITQELYAIFRRERDESVQPVVKEDVAEVLRRRFFTPKSIMDRESFRPHVVAALKGIEGLDEQTRREGKAAEDRFLNSYPFHPDLTEVFYTKWTNLEGFQRTRGVLRTFALALRAAERWDTSPLISTAVFLSPPKESAISEAARELTGIAAAEEYEGRRQEWPAILQGELEKALEIQSEFPALAGREVEQAVFATFLHSQPIGQRMQTRELFLLIGPSRPDKIVLEKALHRWVTVSWFLDDALTRETETTPDGTPLLPKSWRLGSRPNLTQMHHDACKFRVPPELVESRLLEEIGKLRSLTMGVSGQGVRVHNLPEWPRQIEDDGDFHFAVLGPKTASMAGDPSPEAVRYINETTSADKPRVYRNAVVLAVPALDGLEAARNAILRYLGWEEVRNILKEQPVDPVREQLLTVHLESARKAIPEAIRQAYCIVISVSDKNEIQALRITLGTEPLFNAIKQDARVRIQETPVSADALLPGGPYDLWREGDAALRFKDLVTAFAQRPHLPKMLNRQAIYDTLVDGCRQGAFVLRLPRPDRSFRTFWRTTPDETALKDPALEVVLPETATLSEISPDVLAPNILPGLWTGAELRVQQAYEYFSGKHVVKVQRQGYEEPLTIPKADQPVVEAAIQAAVRNGALWLVYGQASIYAEDIPAGLLSPDAVLLPPPERLSTLDVIPERLPEAWKGEQTTALSIAAAVSAKVGRPVPWRVVRDALDGAFNAGYLTRPADSGTWPCDFGGAQWVKVQVAEVVLPEEVSPVAGILIAEADLQAGQIQDLADAMGDLLTATAGHDVKFHLRMEMEREIPKEVVEKVNRVLGNVDGDFRFR